MAPKRKSDAADLSPSVATLRDQLDAVASTPTVIEESNAPPPAKKRKSIKASAPRVDEGEASKPTKWTDITIDGEDEGEVAIYDDCNDIRRKIRALQKEPGFKITHWLKEIGGVNSNSFGRFMKASGPAGGAENGTYEAAYLYFEKNRILQGKKKTPKRIRNEDENPMGLSRRDGNRGVWVLGPTRR